MAQRTLVCCAYPFGYGPAAKLVHLAHGLSGSGLRLVMVGNGIAHELAARCKLFDEVVVAGPTDKRVRTLLRSAAGLLSLMDREYSETALELGCPVFVADSLTWMRDRLPAAFRQARVYWAQEFVGVRERLAEAGSNARVVGPIVAPAEPLPAGQGTRLMVNLGGSESTVGSVADDSSYVDFVMRVVLSLVRREAAQASSVVFLSGKKCIDYLQGRYPDCGLDLRTASHDEAQALFATAAWVLTSPGLTTCLECFQLGVPVLFLPPQNYSQWWILNKLRCLGLAESSFHWEEAWPECPVVPGMAEETRGAVVRDAIRRLSREVCPEERCQERLAATLQGDGRELGRRQRAFFESLGPNGAAEIVNDLAQLC
jgi:hypothetical protein